MAEQENLQRAKDTYAAFLRGDFDSFMRDIADDIEWVTPGPSDLPWAGTVRGKQALEAYLGMLAQGLDVQRFEPYQFIAQGDTVVVLVHTGATVRHNQRSYTNEEVNVLAYRGGKVVRFQTFLDTEAAAAAYRGK
jgi:ketosteroid isomerase-like protein